jgi:hypothetical protein
MYPDPVLAVWHVSKCTEVSEWLLLELCRVVGCMLLLCLASWSCATSTEVYTPASMLAALSIVMSRSL